MIKRFFYAILRRIKQGQLESFYDAFYDEFLTKRFPDVQTDEGRPEQFCRHNVPWHKKCIEKDCELRLAHDIVKFIANFNYPNNTEKYKREDT